MGEENMAKGVEKERNKRGRGRRPTHSWGSLEHLGSIFVPRLTAKSKKLEQIFE